jgi:hypothetical protein
MWKRLEHVTASIALVLFLPVSAFSGEPRIVSVPEDRIPSDAIILFDGNDLSQWMHKDLRPADWLIADGFMTVKGGDIMTMKEFGDIQLHIEFATPAEIIGEGQNRGNSGVYLEGRYEVQVLDSYGNTTYTNGQCGAVYSQYPPLVNASRCPGQWQVYDIIFRAPKLDENGKVISMANLTVFHNGVLIQDHVPMKVCPAGISETDALRGPLLLQDHNCPVRYRNIWIREL